MKKRIFQKSLFFFVLTILLFACAYGLNDIHSIEVCSPGPGMMASQAIEGVNFVQLVTSVLELISYTL